jgi:hypothetical protein
MKSGTAIRTGTFLFGFYLWLLVFSTCTPTEPAATPDPFADFIFSSQQVKDWTPSSEPADSLFRFVDTTLMYLINGGKYSYCGECDGTSALKAGVYYVLVNGVKETMVKVFVMDYGMVDSAKAQFDTRRTMLLGFSTKVVIPSYAESTAIGAEFSGGITALASFDRYYFEMVFSGYDSSVEAAADASLFLSSFQSKVK